MAEAKREHRIRETIIANCGEGNTGKTSSILMLYAKLRKAEGTDTQDILIDEKKDICEVVKINNVLVGISSFGDTRQAVKEHMEDLKKNGCQIIVTACRNNHEMIKLLKDSAQGYRLMRTSNARLYEEGKGTTEIPADIIDSFNKQWAEEIAKLIESWCNA